MTPIYGCRPLRRGPRPTCLRISHILMEAYRRSDEVAVIAVPAVGCQILIGEVLIRSDMLIGIAWVAYAALPDHKGIRSQKSRGP